MEHSWRSSAIYVPAVRVVRGKLCILKRLVKWTNFPNVSVAYTATKLRKYLQVEPDHGSCFLLKLC